MNQDQLEQVRTGKGFIAALDQSGGSTPKALKLYGVDEDQYSGEAEMFDRIHTRYDRRDFLSVVLIVAAIIWCAN